MTSTSPERRRAPGMTPDQRRDAIISAALPLVAEHGAAVTTAQVARAAGIGEATIFRVFDDKEALLNACIARALDPANVLSQLASISLDQPLADRLTEALDALDAHGGRIGAVIGALRASGLPNRRPRTTDAERTTLSTARDESQAATRQALLDLIEPDQPTLRLPAEAVTDAFLSVITGRGRAPSIPPADLVDLFLYGALTRP
ncbi:helix-turn-helix domain-containing protein [Actinoplanes sp. NPDC049596]|uniref:TetR/AcrR family transcriptional regulator n=1 Tax=unclassified Actinoplanes TaxID=2626549 RepID=UPI003442BDAB